MVIFKKIFSKVSQKMKMTDEYSEPGKNRLYSTDNGLAHITYNAKRCPIGGRKLLQNRNDGFGGFTRNFSRKKNRSQLLIGTKKMGACAITGAIKMNNVAPILLN